MDLIWVRHGLPERIDSGPGVPADPQLTAVGHEQAARVAAWLAHERVDAVFSSPLQRARQTADPIARTHGLEVQVLDGLREYDSKADSYIPMEELRAEDDERWRAMVEGRWDHFGGDAPEDFTARVAATVDAIVAQHPGERVVVVCHGGVINVALGHVLRLSEPLWFEPMYTSISRVVASRAGVRSVVSVNERAHLEAVREVLP